MCDTIPPPDMSMNGSSRWNDTEPSAFYPYGRMNPYESISLPAEMEDFVLDGYLGKGSTGSVYKAKQIKEFAVKVIPWQSAHHREMAKHEFEVGRLFNGCEETVHSLDYYEQEEKSFIVMEYGESCLQYFSSHNSSLRDILGALLRVSNALNAIHAKGYSHFDVKPSNIIIARGEAKLGDFSHCSAYLPDQVFDRPMGTGVYIAPEIRIGGKHTGKEDMYALGISMYVLLMAGRYPFDFSNRETPFRDQEDTIDSLYIHPDLLRVIQKAAAYDPNDRYSAFEDFSNDIQAFMQRHDKQLDEGMPLSYQFPFQCTTVNPFERTDEAFT